MITPRPSTLKEVASRVAAGSSFRFELADFLDEFKECPTAAALAEEPEILAQVQERGSHHDSFLAATAEFLSRKHEMPTPDWAFHSQRSLDDPDFDFASREGQLFLLKDSPAAFKSRNLFVTAAVLDRV